MDTTTVSLDEYTDLIDATEIDELRMPLTGWIDPAAPAGNNAEQHIVRSID